MTFEIPKPWSELEVNFPLFPAPMVGLSHVAFRDLIRRYIPEGKQTLLPTEMLSSKRLPTQRLGHTPETFKSSEFSELDLIPQILGNEERFIRPSVKKLEDWGARAIDINMGCPVKQALRHNYGVSLMGNPEYAQEVVSITRQSTSLPIAVKLRAGLQRDQEYLLKFTQGLIAGGANWLCLHPRLAQEKRKDQADWKQIHFLTQRLEVPIIGNGDIQTCDDIEAMFQETQCHGVMMGRALTARPWILWQWGERHGLAAPSAFIGRKPPKDGYEEAQEYGRALIYFVQRLGIYFEPEAAMKRLLFFVNVSHSWLNYGHNFRSKIGKCSHLDEAQECIRVFFNNDHLFMTQKTELRY
jgi:tRNA-dihydrouridine synthase B